MLDWLPPTNPFGQGAQLNEPCVFMQSFDGWQPPLSDACKHPAPSRPSPTPPNPRSSSPSLTLPWAAEPAHAAGPCRPDAGLFKSASGRTSHSSMSTQPLEPLDATVPDILIIIIMRRSLGHINYYYYATVPGAYRFL